MTARASTPRRSSILKEEFFQRKTETVARELLGKGIAFHSPRLGQTVSGRIVETEAYLGLRDPACHSFHGKRTARTEVFYMMGGHIYVYLIYGMYYCLNFITMTDEPEAVLIRALEPMPDCAPLFALENKTKPTDLLNGPGKLCRAFGIDRTMNGQSVESSSLKVFDDGYELTKSQVLTCSRIGVGYAGEASDWPLRYLIADNSFVSKKVKKIKT